MDNNVYIGERYIPKFMGEWNERLSYEALMIVNFGNDSFTSKIPVPINTPPTGREDDPYWASSGGYNGQIAHLQNEIDEVANSLSSEISERESEDRALENAISDGLDSEANARTQADSALHQSISNETSARTQADSALQQSISNETSARTQADNALRALIEGNTGDRKKFFKNKKIMIIGDSLCDPDTYPPNWVTLFKSEVENYGGTVNIDFCNDGDSFAGIAQRLNEFDSYSNIFDIIVVALGVNDYQGQWDIGFYNSTSVIVGSTYDSAAGMNLLLAKLRQKFPKALQFYCPPHRTNHQISNMRYPLAFYRNAFCRIAQYYGMRLIDWSSMPMFAPQALGSSFNGYTSSNDMLHPTSAYAPILKEYVVEKMMSGGDNDWKDSSDSITLQLSSELSSRITSVPIEINSHGRTRIEMAVQTNVTASWAYIFENFPLKLISTVPRFVLVNGDTPAWIEPFQSGIIVHKPNGVSAITSLYIDIEYNTKYPMNHYTGISD